MAEVNSEWKFQNELVLEEFVWELLEPLLNLKRLARQHHLNHQVCDILAVDPRQHLTIVELKNAEDRYIIQQLTRYYAAIEEHRPFPEQVNYQLPIRLVAIAPQFHAHNFIDQDYHRLSFELFTFRISSTEAGQFSFELSQINTDRVIKLDIPQKFHTFLYPAHEEVPEQAAAPVLPPKSLQKLTAELTPEQQAYVLAVRDRLLGFDERMAEIGSSTRTLYGLRKGSKDIYKTKLCAEFIPLLPGILRPRLRLYLPYAKRGFGAPGRTYKLDRVKGFTWVEVRHEQIWDKATPIRLFFYLGKGISRYSYAHDLNEYSSLYEQLTGQKRSLQSLDDLLSLTLEEWLVRLENDKSE